MLDNAEVSLAKVDLGVAAAYAALVESETVREKVLGQIKAEFDRTVEVLLRINGRDELLARQPVLAQSIKLRNPYIAPLHHLQIHYLKRWRQSDDKQRTETLRRLLALTVNGIAFGMKSTG